MEDTAATTAAREATATKKAEKANCAAEIVLVKSVADLDDQLLAVGSANSKKLYVLGQQYDERLARPGFTYPFKPVKSLPSGGSTGIEAKVAHLRSQVVKMIEADLAAGRDLAAPSLPDEALGPNFYRAVPVPRPELLARQSVTLEDAYAARRKAAALETDPELLELEAKYLGKKFTDPPPPVSDGQKGKGKQKRVVRERFVVHAICWSLEREDWVAECVKLDSSDAIPATSKTPMGRVMNKSIIFYMCSSLDVMLDD